MLSTITKTGNTETTEYHHPDRLGTKLITNPATNTAKEQGTLPYGTVLDAETTASTNQKFTSYDRSDKTGLDYAVNRIYSSEQARFLQPDPIGMASADLTDPQSLNMYTYARDNPIDLVDPSGTHSHRPTYYLDGFEVPAETFFSMVLSGAAEPPGGYSGPLGNWESFGETGRRFVPNSLYIHGILDRLEPTSPVHQRGGFQVRGTPLNEKENKKLDKGIRKIEKRLSKNRCKKWLEDHGISISKLLEQLNDRSKVFSAKRSTNITVEDAGLLGENARQGAESLPWRAKRSLLITLDSTVSKWFERRRRVNAAIGSGGSIFYNKFGATTILHENLHVLTGLKDIPLADKFGLKHSGTFSSASSAISKALKANRCS